jgi:protein disulfide-isomerase
MAEQWAELGREMKNQLNIGEVNCGTDKHLCKEVGARGYPTIIYFQSGERIEYEGLRGLGDLVAFAKKAVDSGVKEVEYTDFEEMEKSGVEVAFVFFYDHATTSEDFRAIERLRLTLVGRAPLLKTKSEILARRFRITTWPRIIVVRDGRPSLFPGIAPDAIRDFGRVVSWMRSTWLPIVPELSAANAHEIMNGKTVVLGVLSRSRPDFAVARKELKAAALEFMDQRQLQEKNERQELRDRKQLRIEEAEDRNDQRALRAAKNMRIDLERKKDVGFAWIDGDFWERWVRTTYGIDIDEMGERIIINEQDVSSPSSHLTLCVPESNNDAV